MFWSRKALSVAVLALTAFYALDSQASKCPFLLATGGILNLQQTLPKAAQVAGADAKELLRLELDVLNIAESQDPGAILIALGARQNFFAKRASEIWNAYQALHSWSDGARRRFVFLNLRALLDLNGMVEVITEAARHDRKHFETTLGNVVDFASLHKSILQKVECHLAVFGQSPHFTQKFLVGRDETTPQRYTAVLWHVQPPGPDPKADPKKSYERQLESFLPGAGLKSVEQLRTRSIGYGIAPLFQLRSTTPGLSYVFFDEGMQQIQVFLPLGAMIERLFTLLPPEDAFIL